MANLGNQGTPGSGYWYDDFGNKQFWSGPFAMPSGGGIVTDAYVYVAGDGGNVTGQLLVWDGSGNILWQSGNITIPGGSRSIHGQGWVHVGAINTYVAAGNIYLGFWSSGNVVWTFEGGGGVQSRGGLGSPGTATGGGDEYGGAGYGALGAYIAYSPGAIYYGDGGGVPHQIAAVWYGDNSHVPHKVVAIWVGQSNGVPVRIF